MLRTECKKGHPLTQDNTLINGEGFRNCRLCYNNRQIKTRLRQELGKMTPEEIQRQFEIYTIKLKEIATWLKKS